jgi:hypothetical protein
MLNNNAQNGQQQGGTKKPAQSFRYGAIKCVIWKNEGRNGSFYNTVITRSYKEGDDWKDSSSFGQEDLPTVAKAALDAHTYVQEQLAKDRDAGTPGPQQGETQQPKQRQRTGTREPARV